MKTSSALFALTLVLSGCVTTTSANVEPQAAQQDVELHRTTTGLLFGPCGPIPGRYQEQYWLRLKGPGPVYTRADVEFVDKAGVVVPASDQLDGTVTTDLDNHRVVVALHYKNGYGSPMNGKYRIRQN